MPGIFWWPGHIEPGVVHGIGSLTDLYATALSLAGVTSTPEAVDSIDLSPVLDAPSLKGSPSPRTHFAYYNPFGQFLGYRKDAWKVSFTENGYTPSNKVQLYNLLHDPSETTDLSEVHQNILKNLVDEAKKYDMAIPRAIPIFDR